MKRTFKLLFLIPLLCSSVFSQEFHVFLEDKFKPAEFPKVARKLNRDRGKDDRISTKSYCAENMADLTLELSDGDKILIHAEGLPWIIGRGVRFDKDFDFSPHSLAKKLAPIIQNREITLDLLSCNSATHFKCIGENGDETIRGNFAAELSESLYLLGANHVTVQGYAGYLFDKKFMKYSVKASKGGSKVKHCSLDKGRRIYQNGKLIQEAQTIVIDKYYLDKEETEEKSFKYYLTEKASLTEKDLYPTAIEIRSTVEK